MAGARMEKTKVRRRCDELFLRCTNLSNSLVKFDRLMQAEKGEVDAEKSLVSISE